MSGRFKNKICAFTLAEVLITLGIIGVVAIMTIPSLISSNQERGWNTASTVFERKLTEALKIMNTQGTLAGYRTTEDFVSELSKHLKITNVCQNDDLMSCFEDKISMRENTIKVDLTGISSASDFGLDWGTDLVGIQLANGTNGIVAYNPECKQDPYSNQINGSSCLAILYDTSGYSKPNFLSKDLRANQNVKKIADKTVCAFEIADTCYTEPFHPDAHVWKGCNSSGTTTNSEDLAFMEKYDIDYCMTSNYGTNDYWAGAVAACGGKDKMPTLAQLAKIANYVYETDEIGAKTDWYCPSGDCRKDKKASALGFEVTSGSAFWVWSGSEYSSGSAHTRNFTPIHSGWDGSYRYRSYGYAQAVCKGD